MSLENRIGALPDVFADPSRVRQVFTNLLHNAIKFTENGRITIDAQSATNGSHSIEVTVADPDA